jgi:type I restriction-modification system DNA methylase subunit
MKLNHIKNYLQKVKSSNKELPKKEAFKDLINRLYHTDKEIQNIIDKITIGSETAILNIPRKDKFHRGSADTLYNKVIIEFENNLNSTIEHAKEQLAGYLLGQFNSGEGYNYTLIATDGIAWKIFAPDISQLNILASLKEDELILNEDKSASFNLTENNAEEFYYWIDRFLFKEEKQKASLKRIEEAFGYQSNVFIESYRQLSDHFYDVKKYGEVQVAFEQWSKFLSIAYGSFDASEKNFLIHTYLSVFSKMLAYAVVSNDDYIDDKEMRAIIDGTIFHRFNISNFVDNDFFHWIKEQRNFTNLKKIFRLIAQEISAFDFSDVDEDILKGVYQELIDLDTRHSLGEYYTPDWLCEKIINKYDLTIKHKILDPACGSGSFLLAAIKKLKSTSPDAQVETINDCVYGIDIHPLSVQISKTTVLLALGKDIVNSRQPIHLNVILANTLLAPDGVDSLFGNEFKMMIDKQTLILNSQILDDVKVFDAGIEICDELAEQTMNRQKLMQDVFENNLRRQIKNAGFTKSVIDSFYKIYTELKIVKEKRRDSIWKFIVQNLYKPYFLQNKFDFVIGNPPWFTYSSIRNEEYQDTLNNLAVMYDVKPSRIANFPHLEIAAIFFTYCSSYFLKENGKIAFVLPRSFLSADHHDKSRSGKALGYKLTSIWDLDKVDPLFRIPSCVLFADEAKKLKKRALPKAGIQGEIVSGKLPDHNCNFDTATRSLKSITKKWYFVTQGGSSAFSNKKIKSSSLVNPYKSLFRQGATIVPRGFYFIQLDQDEPPDYTDRLINVKTAETAIRDAKKPWNNINMTGRVNSDFIYLAALSKSILPFALHNPSKVLLPVTIDDSDGIKKINLHSADDLYSLGYTHTAKWFKSVERTWDIFKTEKNKNYTSGDYLNWQNKLTDQNLNKRYIVLYNSSAKDANSFVLVRSDYSFEFVNESKAYSFFTSDFNEANYISCLLNSSLPNKMMKDFQTKGLFGARDVHKKILDIYFPKFDENDTNHLQLARLGETAHKKAKEYLVANPPQNDLTPFHLGRLRLAIKNHLKKEMKEIDKLVKKIIK